MRPRLSAGDRMQNRRKDPHNKTSFNEAPAERRGSASRFCAIASVLALLQ